MFSIQTLIKLKSSSHPLLSTHICVSNALCKYTGITHQIHMPHTLTLALLSPRSLFQYTILTHQVTLAIVSF